MSGVGTPADAPIAKEGFFVTPLLCGIRKNRKTSYVRILRGKVIKAENCC